MWRGEFLSSEVGQRLVCRSRWNRRLRLSIKNFEPRSKQATTADESAAFQESIQTELRRRHRAAYRGPLVLRLGFTTTDRNPSHIHTITKNILDLLGPVRSGPGKGRPLLYFDDRQVEGLTVRCEHGGAAPRVQIEARSLGDFREDLSVAQSVDAAGGHLFEHDDEWESDRSESRGLDGWDHDEYIHLFGRAIYEIEVALAQQGMQRQLLGRNGLRIRDLAHFYRALDPHFRHDRNVLDEIAGRWEETFMSSPFRVTLRELPQAPGVSAAYIEQVREQLQVLRERFHRLLVPLRVPVGLEVVVKAPPPSGAHRIHDLDNMLRRYIIPGIVKTFAPPSHYSWANESVFAPLGKDARSEPRPKSTAVGLVRMEAWRIPRSAADSSPGFVTLALVADEYGHDDTLRAVDAAVDRWCDRD
jgi:hypothetical protein